MRQVELADRECDGVRLEVVSVAEDNHGEMLLWPTDDDVAETDAVPVVMSSSTEGKTAASA